MLGLKKTCGYESTNLSNGSVIPAEGEVYVSLESPAAVSGPKRTILQIFTDSPTSDIQEINLEIEATVVDAIWTVPPQVIVYLNSNTRSNWSQTVSIYSNKFNVSNSIKHIEAKGVPIRVRRKIGQEDECQIELLFDGGVAPQSSQGEVIIHFDETSHQQHKIPIHFKTDS